MDNDALTALWTAQLRERIEQRYADWASPNEQASPSLQRSFDLMRKHHPDAPQSLEAFAAQVEQLRMQRREEEIARALPFALQIGQESGTLGPLTDDQLSQAEIKGMEQHTGDLLSQFETRLQNAPSTMPAWKRQFAEGFLAMAKRHNDLIDTRFGKPDVTEADLAEVTEQVVRDLDALNRTLPRNVEDT